jgi:pre-mRNA branch site protein p14
MSKQQQAVRLPPEVTRALYVRNLPFKITAEEMYDIFGKYGAVRQIRLGDAPATKGTAFVVYEDIYDAKAACDHLSGFNVGGRYLVVLYYQVTKHLKAPDAKRQQAELDHLRARVAAGDAAAAAAAEAAAGGEDAAGDSIDDEEDKRLMQVRR